MESNPVLSKYCFGYKASLPEKKTCGEYISYVLPLPLILRSWPRTFDPQVIFVAVYQLIPLVANYVVRTAAMYHVVIINYLNSSTGA